MNLSRRNFLGGLTAAGAAMVLPGCCNFCLGGKDAKIALQLYSIRGYIKSVGLAKALADVSAIGYKGVEFAGYYGFKPEELKKMLDDNGLVACGTHVSNSEFAPEKVSATCEFNLGYGNSFICCPGGGNMPPKCGWGREQPAPSVEVDDFIKKLCDYYNTAAESAGKYGCFVGLHNHQWEHFVKMTDGTSFWDYFFSNTDPRVKMEQDVGWTTCAGFDPCESYKKYPHRSITLHAKENGMGSKGPFDAILGQPGEGAVGVNWDKLIPVTEADGVAWYVVECEQHDNDLFAVTPSYAFLKSKGLN